jgi:hypothetical protein
MNGLNKLDFSKIIVILLSQSKNQILILPILKKVKLLLNKKKLKLLLQELLHNQNNQVKMVLLT